MKELLLTFRGRITRKQIWTAVLAYVVIAVVTVVLFKAMTIVIPGSIDEDGAFSVDGLAALPYIALGLAYVVFSIWSGICVGIKRYHDRDKSGWWLLIQLVPIIGAIWYFVEVFCLSGTPGPNRFGPDPLGRSAMVPPPVV
jgi:uncharacterized membrane protein YhaH (DUF805 family)